MTNYNRQVNFSDNIEVIGSISYDSFDRHVHFKEEVLVQETLRREDFSKAEAQDYWINGMDTFQMKQDMMRARMAGDPTMKKYTRANVTKTRATIRRSLDTVFEEQRLLRIHQQEHVEIRRHSHNSNRLREPCFWCTSHEHRIAIAYRLATLESKSDALSQGLHLESELLDEIVYPIASNISIDSMKSSVTASPVTKRKLVEDDASSRRASSCLTSPNPKKIVAASA